MVRDSEGVRTREGKLMHRRRSKLGEAVGMLPPKKIINLGTQKRHFLRFSRNTFSKQIRRKNAVVRCFFFYTSLVLSVRYNVNGKKVKQWRNQRGYKRRAIRLNPSDGSRRANSVTTLLIAVNVLVLVMTVQKCNRAPSLISHPTIAFLAVSRW